MKVDRKQIHALFNGHCAYCGCILESESGKHMQVDHVEPVWRKWHKNEDSRNPKNNNESNYFPACPSCNHYKSTMSINDFREQLRLIPERLKRDSVTFNHCLRHGMIEVKEWDGVFYFEKFKP